MILKGINVGLTFRWPRGVKCVSAKKIRKMTQMRQNFFKAKKLLRNRKILAKQSDTLKSVLTNEY